MIFDHITSEGIKKIATERNEIPVVSAISNLGTLWTFPSDGFEVIETNADPVSENENGFSELKQQLFILSLKVD